MPPFARLLSLLKRDERLKPGPTRAKWTAAAAGWARGTRRAFRRPCPTAAAIGIACIVAAGAVRAELRAVDLEIVLAIDASASVDDEEWRLQLDGIAGAFRDPAVQAAALGGPAGAVAAAVVIWADATLPKQESEWAMLDSPAAIEAFAAMVERLPRKVRGGTGIGDGLAVALDMIRYNGIEAPRQVVDISGDGRETPVREELAILIPQARAIALSRGVTVNGLAILKDEPDLDRWYRSNVIAGSASFVMTASDFEDFARAMREKLLRELEVRIGALLPSTPPARARIGPGDR